MSDKITEYIYISKYISNRISDRRRMPEYMSDIILNYISDKKSDKI